MCTGFTPDAGSLPRLLAGAGFGAGNSGSTGRGPQLHSLEQPWHAGQSRWETRPFISVFPDASHPSSHHLPVVVLHPVFSRLSSPHSFLLPIWHLVLSSASTTTFPCTNSLSHSGTETSVTLHLFPKIRCPGRNGLLKNKEVLERHCQRGILQVRQGQGFRGWRLICVCCKRRASVTFHWEILRKFHFQICLVATQQSQNPIIVLILLSEGHFRKNSNDNSCLLRTEPSYSVENWWADLRSLFASVALLPVSRRWGNWIPGPSGSLTSSFYSSRQY